MSAHAPAFHEERGSRLAFLGAAALVFAVSTAVTIAWCGSMSPADEMPLGMFLGMWVVMMVAMMLPSLVPMLSRYRQAVGEAGEARLNRLTALVGAGYFFVWTAFGVAAWPLCVALAEVEMQRPAFSRAMPSAVGLVVLLAGLLQFTGWKIRHLACCREMPGPCHALSAGAGAAWRHGLRLGLHCAKCCAGLIAVLLVLGAMDLRAMALVAAAITAERLAPAGERVARATGFIAIAAGLFLAARALFD